MSDQQLGATLRERRVLLNISIEEASERTGVPAKHLRRIEQSRWEVLPSPVYTKSFIYTYARMLGMDADRIAKRYAELVHKDAQPQQHLSFKKRVQKRFSSVAPYITRRTVAVVVFLAIVAYIGYQLSIVFAEPALSIHTPVEHEVMVTEGVVTLAGKTDPGAELLLNGETIQVSPDGSFERTVELLPGINVLEVRAVSRFGEEAVQERTVIYREPLPGHVEDPSADTSPIPQPTEENNGTVETIGTSTQEE